MQHPCGSMYLLSIQSSDRHKTVDCKNGNGYANAHPSPNFEFWNSGARTILYLIRVPYGLRVWYVYRIHPIHSEVLRTMSAVGEKLNLFLYYESSQLAAVGKEQDGVEPSRSLPGPTKRGAPTETTPVHVATFSESRSASYIFTPLEQVS